MIQANILGVEQKMDFSTKVIRNYVLLEIGGKQIHAEVPDISELSELISAGMGGDVSAQAAPEVKLVHKEELFTSPLPRASSQEPQEALFNWRNLDDNLLPAEVKAAMRMMEVPAVLPASSIDEMAKAILDEFTEDDWANVRAHMQSQAVSVEMKTAWQVVPEQAQPVSPPLAAPPVTAPEQPVVGKVQWTNGFVMKNPRPARTVQADDYGYPVVSGSGVNPSDVVGSSDVVDEDGIGQV
jgi:hypothetical protein